MPAIYWTLLLKLVLERYVTKGSLDSTESRCYRMTRYLELLDVITPKDYLDYNLSTQYFFMKIQVPWNVASC